MYTRYVVLGVGTRLVEDCICQPRPQTTPSFSVSVPCTVHVYVASLGWWSCVRAVCDHLILSKEVSTKFTLHIMGPYTNHGTEQTGMGNFFFFLEPLLI